MGANAKSLRFMNIAFEDGFAGATGKMVAGPLNGWGTLLGCCCNTAK